MEITLNDLARTKIVKDIESRVNSLIPWNILYYRKNLNAYRNDRWVGWVNTPPQLYNFWSLVKIHNPGSTTPPPNTGVFSIALTAPERALFGRTVKFEAFVSQNFAPVSGATVWLNSSFGGLAATEGRVQPHGRSGHRREVLRDEGLKPHGPSAQEIGRAHV